MFCSMWEKGALPGLMVSLVFATGCGGSSRMENSQPSEARQTNEIPSGQAPQAEIAETGWPDTTRKYSCELVYIAPDGTEHALDLGNSTVATVSNTLAKGEPDEFSYKLQFLYHRNDQDFFELTYQTGPNHHKTGGPYGYAGQEVGLGAKGPHGHFVLRPVTPPES